MSRTRGKDDNLYPRLVAVLVGADERARVLDGLRHRVRVVDHDAVAGTAAAIAERRRDMDRDSIAELEAEIRSLATRRAGNEAIHTDLIEEQRRTREAAEWCEVQPARDRDDAEQIANSAETLERHSRVVREANRRLERVLEQRAAAEAALEAARSELQTLGAAGVDETSVRRQMEEASRRLHEVTAEYQERMTEVARRKAEVWDLEDAAAAQESRTTPAADQAGHDQLRAMRAAVQAKFASAETTVTAVDPAQLDRARREASEAETTADEASVRLAHAKTALASLENELTVRSRESDSRAERHAAALELETQVVAVEHRLGEAEARSRDEVDEATRSMSRAELTLERLRQDGRDRRRQLTTFAALVPDAARPPHGDDPVQHAAVIARSLRTHAEAMQPDLDHAGVAIERDRAIAAGKDDEIVVLREQLTAVCRADLIGAIEELAARQLALVIDDVVGLDETATVAADWLVDLDATAPIIVLTTDSAVVGWAIEQPADQVGVTNAASLIELGAHDPASN